MLSFKIRINSDRTYSVGDEVVTRQQLAEKVSEWVAEGNNSVRLIVPKDVGESAVAAEHGWLRKLGVTSIRIQVEK